MTTKFCHKEAPSLLSALFTSSARVEVLRVFLIDPTRAYYQRQLESATGLAIRAVQRELDRLTEAGLLYRRLEGRRAYYTMDSGFPGFESLRELFLVGAPDLDLLRAGLSMDSPVVEALVVPGGDALVITRSEDWGGASLRGTESHPVTVMSRKDFEHCLAETPEKLETFLNTGKDVLGRREDILWHRIEAAGYQIEKGKGVPS